MLLVEVEGHVRGVGVVSEAVVEGLVLPVAVENHLIAPPCLGEIVQALDDAVGMMVRGRWEEMNKGEREREREREGGGGEGEGEGEGEGRRRR